MVAPVHIYLEIITMSSEYKPSKFIKGHGDVWNAADIVDKLPNINIQNKPGSEAQVLDLKESFSAVAEIRYEKGTQTELWFEVAKVYKIN